MQGSRHGLDGLRTGALPGVSRDGTEGRLMAEANERTDNEYAAAVEYGALAAGPAEAQAARPGAPRPPRGPFPGFRLREGGGAGVICEVRGPLAEALAAIESDVLDKRVQVWGSWISYGPPVVKHSYRALRVSRIQTARATPP